MSSTTPDSPVGFPQVAAALAAVDVELRAAAAEATWVIVAGHYPVRSAAEHGDTLQLARLLLPLLRGRGVDAYACGHDHTLQALEDTPTGLRFVVSGNGAEPRGNPNRETSSRRIGFPHAGAKIEKHPRASRVDHPDSETNLAFSSLENGFAVHVVGPESMFTELRGRGGSSLYSMEQAPRAKCAAADVADCPFYDVEAEREKAAAAAQALADDRRSQMPFASIQREDAQLDRLRRGGHQARRYHVDGQQGRVHQRGLGA